MNRIFLCLVFSIIVQPLTAQATPEVTLAKAKSKSRKITIVGGLIEFKAISLTEILTKIDRTYVHEIDNPDLGDMKFDFTFKGKIPSRRAVIRALNEKLIDEFRFRVVITDRHPRFYKLSYPNPEPCADSQNSSSGVAHQWSGNCVKLTEVMDAIMKKFPELSIYGNTRVKVSKVELELKSISSVEKQLAEQGMILRADEARSTKEWITSYR